jgi:hypothetical protein
MSTAATSSSSSSTLPKSAKKLLRKGVSVDGIGMSVSGGGGGGVPAVLSVSLAADCHARRQRVTRIGAPATAGAASADNSASVSGGLETSGSPSAKDWSRGARKVKERKRQVSCRSLSLSCNLSRHQDAGTTLRGRYRV